jgi:hypothetical protein
MSTMNHIGELGGQTVSAPSPFIVRFKDGQQLDFTSLEDACGFFAFYSRSLTAQTQNPAKVYFLEAGIWEEKALSGEQVS